MAQGAPRTAGAVRGTPVSARAGADDHRARGGNGGRRMALGERVSESRRCRGASSIVANGGFRGRRRPYSRPFRVLRHLAPGKEAVRFPRNYHKGEDGMLAVYRELEGTA